MSNVNIKRAIENIRAVTTVYTPVVEMIVNAIQAIDDSDQKHGKISVRALRSSQIPLDGGLADIVGFQIVDNGIGFTDEHRDSFDTLYTDQRITEGGKGFGRFTCLKYFFDLRVASVYEDDSNYKSRTFSMGRNHDIIVGEKIGHSENTQSGTVVTLNELKKGPKFEKRLSTIARNLVERLLPYFITESYQCPEIELTEKDKSGGIKLNDFVQNEISASIREMSVEQSVFTLKATEHHETFIVRLFKLYSPRNHKSRISLVAHKREVSGSVLQKYVPEFVDEFYDKGRNGKEETDRNFIIKAYIFGSYLDRHVSLERGGFEFAMDDELLLGISQSDIEVNVARIAQGAVGADIARRQEKKRETVQTYVDEDAPWHKTILNKIDLSNMPYNPTNEEIETILQQFKIAQEATIRKDVARLLSEGNLNELKDSVVEIVGRISDSSKDELIHYIALRRKILDIFGRSLETDYSGGYSSEGVVHDIVFPRRGDSERTAFHDHNLWIIDERLNFTHYVSSDVPLSSSDSDRPDLLVYDRRVLFRGDNEPSNPISIFEFKRPQRDDFANPSSREDPVQQIIRYVNGIRGGRYRTPQGRDILVANNTPFYGFVVCDLTSKVATWLQLEKNFKLMPDQLGWFQWIENINLYVEVISWGKVVKDAKMRNRIFFEKLGI